MTAQEHGFKAEVQQILDLMIHSVYSDREVFLRELISNAADALDKARFVSLTDAELSPAGHDNPGVRITVNAEAGMIVIEDDGIGMTEEEAVKNLGTIAHSGTKAFLESMGKKESGPDLIGQFGLGFYSAFMVADQVEVDTLSANAGSEPVLWRSKGEGTFEIERGTRTTRGTSISLFLREDSTEFADDTRMQAIVKKHSNYLAWPIFVGEEQANSGKALWTKKPSEVTDEEANQFYKSVAIDWRDPALRIHTSVDTPLQYHAMLFVPSDRPFDLFQPEAPKGPKLYARRVLIDDHAGDLLPDWLRFVRGVVDSEDIELNVSREMVQKTPVLRKIRDQLTKKLLKELKRFANRTPEEPEEGEDGPVEAPATYADVWKAFGVLLKEGYYHDKAKYGEHILPLLRFNASSHDDEEGLISLAEYKEAMAEGQDTIWFLAAENRAAALASPHMEAFVKRGWNVLLLTDAVDEWLVSALPEFDGTPLKSVSRGELDLDDEESDEEKADLTDFAPWVQDVLAGAVTEVRPSTRLTDSACVLVDSEHGVSANMERILKSVNQEHAGAAQRALELNVKHPLIKTLTELHKSGRTEQAEPIVRLLYDDALLLEGTVRDAAGMGRRLQDILVVAANAALGAGSDAS